MGFVAFFSFDEDAPGRRDEHFNFGREERRHNVLSFGKDVTLWAKDLPNPAQKPLALAAYMVDHFSRKGTWHDQLIL